MNQMPPMMKIASGRSLPIVSAFTTHDDCLMPRTLIHVSTSVSAVIVAARGMPVGERRPVEREREGQAVDDRRVTGDAREPHHPADFEADEASECRARRQVRTAGRFEAAAGFGEAQRDRDRQQADGGMNASGPHGPTSAATWDGSRKIALPITWLTPIAVRSHLPSARRSGVSAGGFRLQPSASVLPVTSSLMRAASVSAVNGFINRFVTPVGSRPAPARSGWPEMNRIFSAGPDALDRLREIGAIHARHHDVGDEDVDAIFLLPEHLERGQRRPRPRAR